jgi:hypothetical protein
MTSTEDRIERVIEMIRADLTAVREMVAGLGARLDQAGITARDVAILRKDLSDHEQTDVEIQTELKVQLRWLWGGLASALAALVGALFTGLGGHPK